MNNTSRKRAKKNQRDSLTAYGLCRFEVIGLARDRELILAIARRLLGKGAEVVKLRAALRETIASEHEKKGAILQALRRSPLAGANLEFDRSGVHCRKIDL